jgi:hypothetical protein
MSTATFGAVLLDLPATFLFPDLYGPFIVLPFSA